MASSSRNAVLILMLLCVVFCGATADDISKGALNNDFIPCKVDPQNCHPHPIPNVGYNRGCTREENCRGDRRMKLLQTI